MPETLSEAREQGFRTDIVSFVRRSGRLNARQQRAWDDHADQFVLDVPRAVARTSVDPAHVLDVAATFGRTAPLVVEVGSGLGEAVVNAAESTPGRDFLAVEVYTPGLAQTVLRAAQRGLTNLRLVQANAAEVLTTTLPEGSVDELWIFFPDPWHKARHHKRRLVTPELARLAARVVRPGGTWRLATDWAEYADQMLEVVGADPSFENVHGVGAVAPRFEGRVLTSFENKGRAAGRVITDLEFRRV
ncbi:tRNA (guanosine(46)-N7)-methyltransferase TrmB [Oerskovia turbata]|uniref:tRNA (guanine-N(7)-)-methyltransferase n=1 Tax=Oerskovia turbata TaxID=1713 RepID=A0A4V1N5K3_9CELL|nr:tRNA (guanosine(46)-N7)-methyltransferase TrmB [Oerskovia turbata]RXR28025.1 tRNA (guanosine(46)-N7)-methyltransferase TrmB [Oerskovia turbata]RXR35966.1 tRNA (guanosine(46)-N7)-methyltransferase TrmB [Oerskovia turbata]TGJ94880.1 tRNA (guanosine(46)-N7)-methyltransferase TrmB [Actinotalea fermentans ATCC 43279 = JCM 9966 = DSM 3133]